MPATMYPTRLFSSERGAVALTMAILLPVLLITMALVVDAGRLYAIKSRAQNAADAALLGATASSSTVDPEQEMIRLFNVNYPPNYLGSTVQGMDVDIAPGRGDVTIVVDAPSILMDKIPLLIGRDAGGSNQIIITAGSTGGQDTKEAHSLELALVLDNSESMGNPAGAGGGTKMEALQKASKDMVNILFGRNINQLNKLHISVVPYDTVVNIGKGHSDWMQDVPPNVPNPVRPTGKVPDSGFENTVLTDRSHYDDIVKDKKTGFAAGRERSALCGPYLVIADNSTAAPTNCTCPPGKMVQDPDLVEEKCTEDSETRIITCKEVRTPQSHCSVDMVCVPPDSGPGWDGKKCISNGYKDVSDDAPTTLDKKFTIPFETCDKNNKTIKLSSYLDGPRMAEAVQLGISPNAAAGNYCASYGSGDGPTILRRTNWLTKLAPMLFASNNKTAVFSAIDNMQISGDTRVNIGLMWGWFTLSPKWQGLWDNTKSGYPAAAGSGDKALVLMTDGTNTVNPTYDDTTTAQLCAAIKNQGITIYTVGFGLKNEINEPLLMSCATKPEYYFYSPTGEDLNRSFKQIADTIIYGTLKLSH